MENETKKTMICDRCKKEIDIEAKQCPYCKKWVYSKGNKKALKIIGGIFGSLFALLVVIIIIVAINTPKIDYNNVEMINIDAPYLEVQSNKARAIDLYENKVFKFNGKIDKIYENYIIVSSENNIYSVDFYYDNSYKEQVKQLNIGQTITFGGKLHNDVFGKWTIKNGVILEVPQ